MIEPFWDAIIVGAGPAGAAAAIELADAGKRTLILDREDFPRDKICGDLLSPRALNSLGELGVDCPSGVRIDRVRIIGPNEITATLPIGKTNFASQCARVVSRSRLDMRLLEHAVTRGACFRSIAVKHVRPGTPNEYATVYVSDASGEHALTADAVVLAAGHAAANLLPAASRHRVQRWGIAGRAYVGTTEDTEAELLTMLPITSGSDRFHGYAWAFPSGRRSLNVGVGITELSNLGARGVQSILRESFLRLWAVLQTADNEGGIPKLQTAPIPISRVRQSASRVLVAGDAAGVANPTSGEGIAAALESGRLAADCILSAMHTSPEHYERLLDVQFATRCGNSLRRWPSTLGPLYRIEELLAALRGKSTTASRALSRIVWDTPPHAYASENAVAKSRAVILEEIRRWPEIGDPWVIHTITGALVEPEHPTTALGRLLTVVPEEVSFHAHRRTAIATLALLALIADLHHELSRRPYRTTDAKGSDRIALTLIDQLNTLAIRRLLVLDRPFATELSRAMGTALRFATGDTTRVGSSLATMAGRILSGTTSMDRPELPDSP